MDPKVITMLAMLGFVMRPTPTDVTHLSLSGQTMKDVAAQEQVQPTQKQDVAVVADDGFLDKWIDGCQAKIDKSWVKSDARFGYSAHANAEVAPLMHKTAANVIPLLTAGVFDRDGSMSLDTDVMGTRFEGAIEGVLLAFSDAAHNAMHN